MTTRALLYLRQSKGKAGESEDDALSFEVQDAAIQRYCDQRNYTIVETVKDHDISGERWDRPGIKKLLSLAESGVADVAIVFKMSRFSRDALYQELTHRELKARGVRLESATEQGIDKTLIRLVYGGMAQQQNEDHAEWLKASLEQRARRGLHHARPPYGYRAHRDGRRVTMEIVDDEAAVVRRIYELRAAGNSCKTIATILNSEGIPTATGSMWREESLRRTLSNPTYGGYAIHKGEIVGDLDPEHMTGLIDRTLWHQVQRTFTHGERLPQIKPRSSWLEGLVYHDCGKKMWLHPGRARTRQAPYFACGTSKKNDWVQCKRYPMNVRQAALEHAVMLCLTQDIEHRFTDAQAAIAHIAATMHKPQAIDERARLTKQRAEILAAFKRAEDLVTFGHRDHLWLVESDRALNERLQAVDAQLATYADVPAPADLTPYIAAIDGIAEAFALASPQQRRDVLSLLGAVQYGGNTVRMQYHPEYRHLFPVQTVVTLTYHSGQKAWSYAVSAS